MFYKKLKLRHTNIINQKWLEASFRAQMKSKCGLWPLQVLQPNSSRDICVHLQLISWGRNKLYIWLMQWSGKVRQSGPKKTPMTLEHTAESSTLSVMSLCICMHKHGEVKGKRWRLVDAFLKSCNISQWTRFCNCVQTTIYSPYVMRNSAGKTILFLSAVRLNRSCVPTLYYKLIHP